jgi:beta-1,4-mannosyl-glycoprotein beta-1,4-N-acetylglucosaminyltransferase
MFSHELDLLEIRFGILDECVDFFVLIESDLTFSGKRKTLHFQENSNRFKKWKDKIIYNKIEIPHYDSPWDRETFSRNAPLYAVNYNDEDIIMSSDADEIPRPEIVRTLPTILNGFDGHATFKHSMYIYYLNNFETHDWYGTRAATYKNIKNKSLQYVRDHTGNSTNGNGIIIQDAGWHFTSCGDSELIKTKIQSFSHLELDREDVLDNIQNNIESNNDIYYREANYQYVPIDESFPDYIRNNIDKYSHIIHVV